MPHGMRLVIVTTHPIQYQAPLFRALAREVDLSVVFMMEQTPQGHAAAGFGKEFTWDVPLLDGYEHTFARNVAPAPSTSTRRGIVLRDHAALLSSLKPTVLAVFGWFPHGYLQVIRWATAAHVPLVCRGESNLVSERSGWRDLAKRVLLRRFFQRFAAFGVIGRLNREFYQHHGVPDEKLVDAPYSIDTPFFEAEYARCRPAKRRAGPWRIGFSGKLIEKKRPLDLVRAICEAQLANRVTVVVIGDGPLRPEMERLARELGVHCEFRGFLNQSEIVRDGYADVDLLVLPSGLRETWGLVVNEAMTGGIPAIVSDTVGCGPDLIEPGATGHVFRSGAVDDLAMKLASVIEQLDGGHDFAPAVRKKISGYSLARTCSGFREAVEIASR